MCKIDGRPDVLLKVPRPFEEHVRATEIEKRVYRRLGEHPNLIEVVDIDEWGIYLKRAELGSIRDYYRNGGAASLDEKIKWCKDLVDVVQHVHSHNVRHADLSGRNVLLDSSRRALLCDFSGSAIDGDPAIIIAEIGFRHPDRAEYLHPTMRSELHSLGSTMYEILTGNKPFHDVINAHNVQERWLQEAKAEKLVQEGRYPDITNIPLRDVIAKCWSRQGVFNSASEVSEELDRYSMPAVQE